MNTILSNHGYKVIKRELLPKQVKEICAFCDGAVVGSSIVKIIEENIITNKDKINLLISKFVQNLKKVTYQ